MRRRIIGLLLAGLLTLDIIVSGCEGEEKTEPVPTSIVEPTHISSQLSPESIQLPREVEYETVGTTSYGILEHERNSYGRIVRTYFNDVRTINCENDFYYTITTVIIFEGNHGEEPVRKTVTYAYPTSTDESIPTDKPYPVFSPMEIVTGYIYEDQENPLPSEYQGSTSSVIIENLGASGDITVIVEDCLITFYLKKGEKVKVTAHLNELLPFYDRPISWGETKIGFTPPCRWEARQALLSDVCQGEVSIDIWEDTGEAL